MPMMTKNKILKTWLALGLCRNSALANSLECRRQYINKLSTMDKGISDQQWNSLQNGMCLVELKEETDLHHIEQNILKAARLSHNTDQDVQFMAEIALDKWINIIGTIT